MRDKHEGKVISSYLEDYKTTLHVFISNIRMRFGEVACALPKTCGVNHFGALQSLQVNAGFI